MALAVDLLEQLKGELKQHGLTYKQVAEAMDISESSVKRLFRDRDMSLSRLESICSLMDFDISDLAARSDEARRQITQLTRKDEEALVGDETLFLIAVHLIYGWSFDQVMEAYDLDEHQAQRHLTTLDRMKVIELMPENRARVLLSADFEWISGGPIQTFYEQNLQGHFFKSTFSKAGELRLVTNAWMSLEYVSLNYKKLTTNTHPLKSAVAQRWFWRYGHGRWIFLKSIEASRIPLVINMNNNRDLTAHTFDG